MVRADDHPPSEEPPGAIRDRLGVAADGVLGKAVAEGDVPGAVLLAVKDGQVVFLRGYGLANLETKRPVDAGRTLFYVASLTKIFTATAVMQMVEQGKLDLQADVNHYLKTLQVDDTFPEPVTLAHLLTHTAGFDDRSIGYAARTADKAQPLGVYLARALPPRVRPPGQVTAYSNHGYGLAGYLVEVVSGKPYADYLEESIFRPLGMSRATARIPLPPHLAGDLATGYEYDFRTGRLEPRPLDFRNVPPAGSVSATASDMSRFLVAHLQDGRLAQTRILRAETARQMHARQFTHHPRLPGMTFGFFEGEYRGARILQHPGAAPGYSALAVLVPEHGLGVFVATNTSALGVNRRAVQAALDLFLPEPETTALPTPPADFAARAARFVGCYQSTRYSKRSIEKFAIWDSQLCIQATPAGILRVEDRRGDGSEWVEIEPLLFRSTTQNELMAFREKAGRIIYMFGEQTGFPTAFEKLPWWESIKFQLPYVMLLVTVMSSTFTLWPLAVWGKRLSLRLSTAGAKAAADTAGVSSASRPGKMVIAAAVLAGILAVALMPGLDAWLGHSLYRLKLIYGMTPEMVALLWAAIAFALLALLLLVFALQAWRRCWWTRWGRVYYSIIAVTALLFVLFLAQWNLLGFRY